MSQPRRGGRFRILDRVTDLAEQRTANESAEALGLDGLPVDPALIAEAVALDEGDATARHSDLAERIEQSIKQLRARSARPDGQDNRKAAS